MGLLNVALNVDDEVPAGGALPVGNGERTGAAERPLPVGAEAMERSVLAVLMRDKAARVQFATIATNPARLFCNSDNRALAAICMDARGDADPAYVESLGGHEWSAGYLEGIWFGFHPRDLQRFDGYIVALVQLWQRREGLVAVADMTDRLRGATDSAAVPGMLVEGMESIRRITAAVQTMHAPDVASRLDQLEAEIAAGDVTRLRPFGIAALDKRIGGLDFDNADFMVVAGASGAGKTRFVLNVVGNMCSMYGNEARVCWISTESGFTPRKLVGGLVAMRASRRLLADGNERGISARDYLMGAYKGSGLFERAISHAVSEIRAWNLLLYGPDERDGGAQTLGNALALANLAIEGHGCNIVVLDNYQQLHDPEVTKAANVQYLMLLQVVGAFARLVSSKGVVHIGISQLSRAGEILGGESLKYQANVVLGLRNGRDVKDGFPDEIFVDGIKVREGSAFRDLRMLWDVPSGLLRGERIATGSDSVESLAYGRD